MSDSQTPALSQKEITLNNIQELRAELKRCIAIQSRATYASDIERTNAITNALKAEMKFYKTLTCRHRKHRKSSH